jgi:hypothetical protein
MLYMLHNLDLQVGSSDFLEDRGRLVQKHTCWSGANCRKTLASALAAAGDWASTDTGPLGDRGRRKKWPMLLVIPALPVAAAKDLNPPGTGRYSWFTCSTPK